METGGAQNSDLAGGFLRGCDGSEPLLSRRVPDLQFHPLPVDVHCSDFKVHADGGDVAACDKNMHEHVHTCRDLHTSAPKDGEQLGVTTKSGFSAQKRTFCYSRQNNFAILQLTRCQNVAVS